eukprot:scaffold277889_cov20-Prasinocladus_malaysianus.AAC.1
MQSACIATFLLVAISVWAAACRDRTPSLPSSCFANMLVNPRRAAGFIVKACFAVIPQTLYPHGVHCMVQAGCKWLKWEA